MKTSVLINCYNYEEFVAETILSVAAQTKRPDELIVVDDGSTDGSAEVIRKTLGEIGFGQLVEKENGGQLSAFQSGIESASGEWIFFLDADDVYEPTHVEVVLDAVKKNPLNDFFFTRTKDFGGGESSFVQRFKAGDLGQTAFLTQYGTGLVNTFVGGMTSTLCVRRTVLDALFPFDELFLKDWRIRADNVLVQGAGAIGARKFHIYLETVNYRVHGNNAHAGKSKDKPEIAHYTLVQERLMGLVGQISPLGRNGAFGLVVEYQALTGNPYFQRLYWKTVIWGNIPLPLKLRCLWGLLKEKLRKSIS